MKIIAINSKLLNDSYNFAVSNYSRPGSGFNRPRSAASSKSGAGSKRLQYSEREKGDQFRKSNEMEI